MNRLFLSIAVLFYSYASAQSLQGYFQEEQEQYLFLYGYEGVNEILLDSTLISNDGKFSLSFAHYPNGVGYLSTAGKENQFLLILNSEDIEISGKSISSPQSIQFTSSKENQLFYHFVKHYPFWNNALNALEYTQTLYQQETTKTSRKKFAKRLQHEISRLQKEENDFLASLQGTQVVGEYIKIKKLLSELPDILQIHPHLISKTTEDLQAINFSDEILYRSGILKEAIEYRLWFIEKTVPDETEKLEAINLFLAQLVTQTKQNDALLQEISTYTLEALRKKKLDKNSNYLIEQMLEDASLCLSDDFKSELASFKKLDVGDFAPDFSFGELSYFPTDKKINSLSELESDYKIIVFAASWCGHCVREVPKINEFMASINSSQFEVVLVSLEQDETAFQKFSEQFNFIATTDLQMWQSPIARSYHVQATPSYFILNKDLSIMAMPQNTKLLIDLVAAIHKKTSEQ